MADWRKRGYAPCLRVTGTDMIIGLTGPTGAGKTSALMCLRDIGFAVIDCDAVYHRLLAESKPLNEQLALAFPDACDNGVVDRKRLAAIVFSDEERLRQLNGISHSAVRSEVLNILSALAEGADAAIDAVELISGGLAQICDLTVAVLAPKEARIRRIMERDGIDIERARMRVDAQKPDSYYRENCDMCIVNDFDSAEQFSELCAGLFRQLKEENK